MFASKAPCAMGDLSRITTALTPALDRAVAKGLAQAEASHLVARLWAKDASLWTGGDEAAWLGWLDIADRLEYSLSALRQLRADTRHFSDVLLLGMGGSSLGPEVIARSFGRQPGSPRFHVLDTTDPTQIRAAESALDLSRTLVILSSKSGNTLEPGALRAYFQARLASLLGAQEAANRLIAITDPGSPLHQTAVREGFRHVFLGDPTIGGRYSVLSLFGLVPAAAMGLDPGMLIEGSRAMAAACTADAPSADNPGLLLGAILGAALADGRDKVTIYSGPGLDAFGAWAEQLIAESTGKNGRGIVPIDAKDVGAPASYRDDRLFIQLRLKGRPDRREHAIQALQDAGHPVVRIDVAAEDGLVQEFFRWEFATAVVGATMGINPFDQPDVESAKIETRKLTDAFELLGALPEETPIFAGSGLELYADPENAAALAGCSGGGIEAYLRAHFSRIGPGDYAALLAFLPMNAATEAILERTRLDIMDATQAAVCLGFGPRFLHSTGQVYKGGANNGVFLQITCADAQDLPVPGKRYGFGIVKAAQARGDFAVLGERHRRALRVHLGVDPTAGLTQLAAAIIRALGPA